ncbi:MAG: hypothetical protein AW07_02569 [Candidatus Accumulibacter sp. SK-11]|nr:MAG: hypothetical protein AW07_02569 [Candidatus Accumulibacter sp. SK-11]
MLLLELFPVFLTGRSCAVATPLLMKVMTVSRSPGPSPAQVSGERCGLQTRPSH